MITLFLNLCTPQFLKMLSMLSFLTLGLTVYMFVKNCKIFLSTPSLRLNFTLFLAIHSLLVHFLGESLFFPLTLILVSFINLLVRGVIYVILDLALVGSDTEFWNIRASLLELVFLFRSRIFLLYVNTVCH